MEIGRAAEIPEFSASTDFTTVITWRWCRRSGGGDREDQRGGDRADARVAMEIGRAAEIPEFSASTDFTTVITWR
ncbi:hypothetical protein CTI14_67450, partial [Methylobacterium radiotolerans]